MLGGNQFCSPMNDGVEQIVHVTVMDQTEHCFIERTNGQYVSARMTPSGQVIGVRFLRTVDLVTDLID